jgi:uncharacterized protein Usg
VPEMTDAQFACQLQGYRLATAEILYHLPDHPSIIQSFVWQNFDLFPEYPKLMKFLKFWEKNLDGRLHSVTVGAKQLIATSEIGNVEEFVLH